MTTLWLDESTDKAVEVADDLFERLAEAPGLIDKLLEDIWEDGAGLDVRLELSGETAEPATVRYPCEHLEGFLILGLDPSTGHYLLTERGYVERDE